MEQCHPIMYDKGHKSTLSAASRAVYQHDSPDYNPSSYPSHESTDHADTGTITGGIDMPAEDFYRIHTTTFRETPPVGFFIPRKPSGSPCGPKLLHPNP